MPESKVIAFKIAGNWGGFPMQIDIWSKNLSFLYVVLIMLYNTFYIGSGLVAW